MVSFLPCKAAVVTAITIAVLLHGVRAFLTQSNTPRRSMAFNADGSRSTTQLAFNIPSFLPPKGDDAEDVKKVGSTGKTKAEEGEKKKIDLKGILQLITAGAGAPFLGDFEGVDEETGKFMFSLEANNLVDENGDSLQTKATYFEEGWVDPNDKGFQWPWEKKT